MKIFPVSRGLALLGMLAAILLFSDLNNRNKSTSPDNGSWNKKSTDQPIKINIILYNDSPVSEDTEKGFITGLGLLGMKRNLDYTLQVYNGQGDIATVNTIVETVLADPPDLLFTATTPIIQAVSKKIENIPVFFATVADPVVAGLGRDFNDHLPNLTGISTMSDFEQMIRDIKVLMPHCKTLGTIMCPVEANSVAYDKYLRETCEEHGIKLISVPANSTSEVPDAALSLVNHQIDAVCQLSDNLTGGTFAYIVQSADKKGLPYFSFTEHQADKGSVMTIARDYRQAGVDAVMLAKKYMAGTPVKDIPFDYVSKTTITINKALIKKYGLKLTQELEQKADKIIE
jgi:ABC-type uncharacterized transport system substrate-binding protein